MAADFLNYKILFNITRMLDVSYGANVWVRTFWRILSYKALSQLVDFFLQKLVFLSTESSVDDVYKRTSTAI